MYTVLKLLTNVASNARAAPPSAREASPGECARATSPPHPPHPPQVGNWQRLVKGLLQLLARNKAVLLLEWFHKVLEGSEGVRERLQVTPLITPPQQGGAASRVVPQRAFCPRPDQCCRLVTWPFGFPGSAGGFPTLTLSYISVLPCFRIIRRSYALSCRWFQKLAATPIPIGTIRFVEGVHEPSPKSQTKKKATRCSDHDYLNGNGTRAQLVVNEGQVGDRPLEELISLMFKLHIAPDEADQV
eukprot:413447-Prorocentrum_minimum.AAC.2